MDGIRVIAAATLHIVGCEIERFTDDGIEVQAGAAETFITDTVSRNNGDEGMVVSGNGSTRLTVDRSRFVNNGFRGATLDNVQSSVTRSTFSGNGNDGLAAGGGTMTIVRSTAASNGGSGFTVNDAEVQMEASLARGNASAGVFVIVGTATASISNMTVTDNNVGIRNDAVVRTRGNNRVVGNATDIFNNGAIIPLGGT